VTATSVPVNADFQSGFGVRAHDVAESVKLCVATGIAGLSIEDSTKDPATPLFEFSLAVERVKAAREALDNSDHGGVVLTARSEGFVVGRPDLAETIRRLTAYADAGADCLFAPGVRTREQISAVVNAVSPKPVNVLAGSGFMTMAELAALGVRRVSVGGALARAAWTGFLDAAKEIAQHGTFTGLERAVPSAEFNQLFD
jgi:2-methylisocitrate lyase-like PEP mutase family enzyme